MFITDSTDDEGDESPEYDYIKPPIPSKNQQRIMYLQMLEGFPLVSLGVHSALACIGYERVCHIHTVLFSS